MTIETLPTSTRPLSLRDTSTAVSQATAVEQSRAIAEVQAAVIVAQSVPRDIERAYAEMRETTGRLATANKAFYSVPNRGAGPSVHLARELARIWGNLDYGVKELRRDDDAGISEVEAFAWDMQTNVRSRRLFVVPHERMKKGKREPLTDLGDIYLNNQNVGARAVRECIFTVLPAALTDEAEDNCRATLEKGDGVPLDQRIANMVAAFQAEGVSAARLEKRIGRKRGQWTPADLAQMGVTFQSIRRGDTTIADEFPDDRPTAPPVSRPQDIPAHDPDTAELVDTPGEQA
jgi:hypothetical protein